MAFGFNSISLKISFQITLKIASTSSRSKAAIYLSNSLFSAEWKRLYEVVFEPLYYEDIIIEAREALTTILNSDRLPNYNFDDLPTYNEYWTFVKNNSVQMSAITDGSGLIFPATVFAKAFE